MSGNIQNVNLQKLSAEIEEYTTIANKMHNSVTDICTNMKNFSTCWSGQRINSVITLWNNNYQTISNQVEYFAMKIKIILLEIKDQYTAMEKGAPKDSGYGYGFGGILKVPLTDASTIKFEQAKAETIVKNINTDVNNAVGYLKQLVSKLDSMQGYSDSLKTLATTYKSMGGNLQKTLTNLVNQISNEAQKALNDVKTSEAYNEKDAKRAGNV